MKKYFALSVICCLLLPLLANSQSSTSLGFHVQPSDSGVFDSNARFFQAWEHFGFQAGAQYNHYKSRQEAQFDTGLAVRFGSRFQSGLFTSVKNANVDRSGSATAGAVTSTFDFVIPENQPSKPPNNLVGRIGGFLSLPIMNNNIFDNTSGSDSRLTMRGMTQGGVSAQLSWARFLRLNDPAVEFQYSYLRRTGSLDGFSNGSAISTDRDSHGLLARFTKPIHDLLAIQAEFTRNSGLIHTDRADWHASIGVSFGASPRRPYSFALDRPVPVEIPAIRYEILEAIDIGAPIADAGADQTVAPGTILLNGAKSHSADGSTNSLSFRWASVSPPNISITNANQAQASFVALANSVYVFKLTVTDTRNNRSSTAFLQVTSTQTPVPPPVLLPRVVSFEAIPSTIKPGGTAQLYWEIENADSVLIEPGGLTGHAPISVSPAATTQYRIVALRGTTASSPRTVTVTVEPPPPKPVFQPPHAVASIQSNPFGGIVILDGSLSVDPQGLSLTYLWVQVSGPAKATIKNDTAATTEVQFSASGAYFFDLVVTNSEGLTDRARVGINR